MREYMLHVILKNIRNMLKCKVITKRTYEKFNMSDEINLKTAP